MLDQVGFVEIRRGCEVDVFSGSAHESDAKEFETRGITSRGVKRATSRDVSAAR